MEKATFAAGCFWGVEAEFRNIPGVTATAVGYTGGHTSEPTYRDVCSHRTGHAEAVRVEFDPAVISYEQLLDEFWHQHIVDTRKYAADCELLFGKLLHHDPYFGINGEEDRASHQRASEWTQRLWREAFGEPLYGEAERCSSTDCR